MNRNFKIRQISIPVYDDKDEPTTESILYDVVSIEKLKTYVQVEGGGTLTTEGIYLVCFENMEGNPKKLRVINADSELITVTKYEKYGTQIQRRNNKRF